MLNNTHTAPCFFSLPSQGRAGVGFLGAGERVWKLSGEVTQMKISGKGTIDVASLSNKTLYVSPYVVYNQQGYSKHYYAGAERVSSRLGGGTMYGLMDPINDTVTPITDEYPELASRLWGMLQRSFTNCLDLEAGYIGIEHRLNSVEHSVGNDNPENNWYIYHSDHLGSSSFLTDASGTPIQHLQYLPFGENFIEQRATTDYYTPYTFSAKERDPETGYSYFGARYYDPNVSVWLSVDPLSDKYPGMSPFMYCAGNPLKFIDPKGLSYSYFDENGNYIKTEKNNLWHNFWFGRKGRIIDKDGNIKQTFEFADPKNDIKDLESGEINRIQFVTENEIILMLSKSRVFNKENKTYNNPLSQRYEYILKESPGHGKLDFAITQVPIQYPNISTHQTLFLVDGMAHNRSNFGNFLWGAAGKALGLTLQELRTGAHWRALTQDGDDGYENQFDSLDDQRSILKGYQHAKKNDYKRLHYKATIKQ